MFDSVQSNLQVMIVERSNMATLAVATTLWRLLPIFVYRSGDPCGRHLTRATLQQPCLSPQSNTPQCKVSNVAMWDGYVLLSPVILSAAKDLLVAGRDSSLCSGWQAAWLKMWRRGSGQKRGFV